MGPGFGAAVAARDVEHAMRFALITFVLGLVAGFGLGAWLI